MNPFEMVAIIVVAVMIASVIRAKYQHGHRSLDAMDPREQAESLRLREEVRELKERIKVLERIATEDRETKLLSAEIESLREK